MTDYYNLPDLNCSLLNECKIKEFVDLMQKKYISYWNHTLQHSQKLNFYHKIKSNYSPPAYLDLTRKNPSRKTLVKLRISSHKPRIKTGRYDNIPRDERQLWQNWRWNSLFIRLSKFFFHKRDVLLWTRAYNTVSTTTITWDLIIKPIEFYWLFQISFISSCFELRDKLVSKIVNLINPTDGWK